MKNRIKNLLTSLLKLFRRSKVPRWYSKTEMYDWLRRHHYSEQIANELAEAYATNLQAAYEKGFYVGQRTAKMNQPELDIPCQKNTSH